MNNKKLLTRWAFEGDSQVDGNNDVLISGISDALSFTDAEKNIDDNPLESKIQIEIEKVPVRDENYIYIIKVYSINENN